MPPESPDPSNNEPPLLEARGVSKSFGGVHALQAVDFDLRPGEVHALMGENGAGKSTLMKILAGLLTPDEGEVRLRGESVRFSNPHEAMQHGIAMIHQELMPVPEMSVAENLMLGREPRGRIPGTIDRKKMATESRRLLEVLDMGLPVSRPMKELSVAGMQTVEIARAIGSDASIVIMDEPTAAISDREVSALFAAIDKLRARGVGAIYITHKMDEVSRIADRITVLRDGKHVATRPADELDGKQLISLMVGRELLDQSDTSHPVGVEVVLSVSGLGRRGDYHDISFEVRKGEVLGLAGLMGAGRSEVVSAIFGLAPAERGVIEVGGVPVRIREPAGAIRLGIGMVTEDRKDYGIIPELPVAQNVTLAALREACRGPVISPRREMAMAGEAVDQFGIKCTPRQKIGQLSGGNQQKAVIARTMMAGPSIVILDEPTRGIDVAAKSEVYQIIRDLTRKGTTVLLVSSELPELLAMSDRILVMREGKITARLDPGQTTQEEILRHAIPV
ncbi:sugar ABC transporter ATP-binding protein [Haloferula sp. A504]|uniref:sugar ABC transporter ATP-binding protein n=1 Tax=Haloferula sp. A504 TaxID=3373601 RepID=UPI0031BD4934|nr:sugar ABC transporter ATP-binding protein [Verrucomicrobiaceae bacterium E54]